jgi:hypothetical protein
VFVSSRFNPCDLEEGAVTMAGTQRTLAAGLVILLGVPGALAQEPLDVLNKHGLTKSGTFFVVASEEPVLQKLFNLRPAMGQMEEKYMKWAGILQNEYEFQALNDYRIQLQGHLNDVRGQVAAMPQRSFLERQAKAEAQQYQRAVDQELRDTNTQVERRRSLLVGPAEKARAERDFNNRREAFVDAKGQVWPMVEQTMKEYEQLKENDSVGNAIRAYNQAAKAHLKPGPSDKFKKSAQQVIAYERNYSPETATKPKKMPKRKGLQMQKKRK